MVLPDAGFSWSEAGSFSFEFIGGRSDFFMPRLRFRLTSEGNSPLFGNYQTFLDRIHRLKLLGRSAPVPSRSSLKARPSCGGGQSPPEWYSRALPNLRRAFGVD